MTKEEFLNFVRDNRDEILAILDLPQELEELVEAAVLLREKKRLNAARQQRYRDRNVTRNVTQEEKRNVCVTPERNVTQEKSNVTPSGNVTRNVTRNGDSGSLPLFPSLSPPHTPPLTPPISPSPPHLININARVKRNRKAPESYEELEKLCLEKLGLTVEDAKTLWDHWRGNGFTNNGRPMADWRMVASCWERKGIFFPSKLGRLKQQHQQNGNGKYKH